VEEPGDKGELELREFAAALLGLKLLLVQRLKDPVSSGVLFGHCAFDSRVMSDVSRRAQSKRRVARGAASLEARAEMKPINAAYGIASRERWLGYVDILPENKSGEEWLRTENTPHATPIFPGFQFEGSLLDGESFKSFHCHWIICPMEFQFESE
jgi:hypothetical protein